MGARAKQRYDRFVRSSVLLSCDRGFVRNLSKRGGQGKLQSYWEDRVHVHVVVRRKGDDSPMYEVRAEVGSGGNRILHVNLLLPCSYLHINIPRKISHQKRAGQESWARLFKTPIKLTSD